MNLHEMVVTVFLWDKEPHTCRAADSLVRMCDKVLLHVTLTTELSATEWTAVLALLHVAVLHVATQVRRVRVTLIAQRTHILAQAYCMLQAQITRVTQGSMLIRARWRSGLYICWSGLHITQGWMLLRAHRQVHCKARIMRIMKTSSSKSLLLCSHHHLIWISQTGPDTNQGT